VLRFFPPETIVGIAGGLIRCRILENGWQEEDDLAALFDEEPMEQILRGQEDSEILTVTVTYSNLDDIASQKTWNLSFRFWWDYVLKRPSAVTQHVELV
jgi:hypothetical protein